MSCGPSSPADPINEYAVVSYIPDSLGEFITRLRKDLVDGCMAESHVTILPPRPLGFPPEVAQRDLFHQSADFHAFELEIGQIQTFTGSSVIYADIHAGREHLIRMHDVLNRGSLFHKEMYTYHPHVTLAQGFDPETLPERLELARHRWQECPQLRVHIENLVFVQNTNINRWLDLAACELRSSLVVTR